MANKNKTKKNIPSNILEGLRDLGSSTASSLVNEVIRPEDVLDQIFGQNKVIEKASAEIGPGESLTIEDMISGKEKENATLKKNLFTERRLAEEERIRVEKKTAELKIQIKKLMEELTILNESTQELSEEVKIASMQAPVEPGIYHTIFFEKLIEFIKSIRKKIYEASNWLMATNKRAQKKNYWARYKKHGAKFLLSGEHYLTRSTG